MQLHLRYFVQRPYIVLVLCSIYFAALPVLGCRRLATTGITLSLAVLSLKDKTCIRNKESLKSSGFFAGVSDMARDLLH
jgi:hypothetical protein